MGLAVGTAADAAISQLAYTDTAVKTRVLSTLTSAAVMLPDVGDPTAR